MSRTYRRKEGIGCGYQDKTWACSEWVRITYKNGDSRLNRVPLPKDSDAYKKASSIYHSDTGTHYFKEPGPSWFRNVFCERPQRREARRQLRKYMLNEEYEVCLNAKDHLPYWL